MISRRAPWGFMILAMLAMAGCKPVVLISPARALVAKLPRGKELLALESASPVPANGAQPVKDTDPIPINALAIGKNKALVAANRWSARFVLTDKGLA